MRCNRLYYDFQNNSSISAGFSRMVLYNIRHFFKMNWMRQCAALYLWRLTRKCSFFQLHSDVPYVHFCWHFIQHWGLKICSFLRRIEWAYVRHCTCDGSQDDVGSLVAFKRPWCAFLLAFDTSLGVNKAINPTASAAWGWTGEGAVSALRSGLNT